MSDLAAVAELAKLGLASFFAYMRLAGLTDAQIDEAYQKAKAEMLLRNPDDIPE
jgi:hypothetical protein